MPWLQWKEFHIEGVVSEAETGRPLSGLRVAAFDQDWLQDDYLGEAETDPEGRFELRFGEDQFKDVIESQPDLYLCIFRPGTREPIHNTAYALRRNADQEEFFDIQISRSVLD